MILEAFAEMFSAISIDGNNPRDPALAKMLGLGMQSKSGIQVTHDKVLALPAIFRAMNIISNGMAKLPWCVKKKTETGSEEDKTHPAWKAITRKPSPDFTIGPWKKTMTAWAMGWGNGVSAIIRPNWPAGPIEFVPLLPDRTRLVRYRAGGLDTDIEGASGELRYYTKVGDDNVWFSSEDVIHIRGLGGSPYWGYDIVEILKESFGGAIAKDEFSHRFFGQGANPAGFIEMPGSLDEESEETWLESMRKASHGLGSAHKFVLLEEGAKFHQVTIDPEKSQLLEGKQLDIRLLAMSIGIKVHKLIDGANSAFASLEQANHEHKEDDLVPWICAFKEEFNEKLLTEEQKDSETHCIEPDEEGLEWVEYANRSRTCVDEYNNGIITKDEARDRLNYGPSNSEYGSRFRIPANIVFEEDEPMVNGSTITSSEDNSDPAEEDSAPLPSEDSLALAEMAVDFLGNFRTRLIKQAIAKSEKGSKAFLAWVDDLKSENSPKAVKLAVNSLFASIKEQMNNCGDVARDDTELIKKVSESVTLIQAIDLETLFLESNNAVFI